VDMMNAMEMPDTGGLSYPVVLYLAPGLACGAKAFTFPEAYRARPVHGGLAQGGRWLKKEVERR